jgi:hypothetical protein
MSNVGGECGPDHPMQSHQKFAGACTLLSYPSRLAFPNLFLRAGTIIWASTCQRVNVDCHQVAAANGTFAHDAGPRMSEASEYF